MTKPDDIDQDAWEKAGRAWVRGASSENITNSGRETVARAIMSARAEEREAILALVRPYKHHDTGHEIYEAIRNRP
jgi:hypothetical protein